ncbi:NTF2 fold immunity protein [Hymenobacter sp. UYP22]|uniref:YbbC/YhhH family protein n=1 Tax=Hymenobacter sp. UYP22 TaxID=3156348 RepID=UPI003396805F
MTKSFTSLCTAGLLALSICGCAQGKKHSRLGREIAREELQEALQKQVAINVSTVTQALPDSAAAVRVAEPILFRTYGQKNIVHERPYEVYLIDKYWVLMGTLPKDSDGGVFTIILNSQDSRVIELTHGK